MRRRFFNGAPASRGRHVAAFCCVLVFCGDSPGGLAQQTPSPGSSSAQQSLPTVGPDSDAQSTAATQKVETALPDVPPINANQAASPTTVSPAVERAANSKAQPVRDQATGLQPNFLGFLGPYRRPYVPPLFPGSGERLNGLIRDGKLYLSLHDALALVIENNLEVQIERYNLQLAETDIVRASGGGSTRGINFNVAVSAGNRRSWKPSAE